MITVPANIVCDNCERTIEGATLKVRPAPGPPYGAHGSTISIKGARVLPDGSVACSDSCYDKLAAKSEHV